MYFQEGEIIGAQGDQQDTIWSGEASWVGLLENGEAGLRYEFSSHIGVFCRHIPGYSGEYR